MRCSLSSLVAVVTLATPLAGGACERLVGDEEPADHQEEHRPKHRREQPDAGARERRSRRIHSRTDPELIDRGHRLLPIQDTRTRHE